MEPAPFDACAEGGDPALKRKGAPLEKGRTSMRFMVMVKATKESEAESHPLEMEGAEEMFERIRGLAC